jgi:hypothetical protein
MRLDGTRPPVPRLSRVALGRVVSLRDASVINRDTEQDTHPTTELRRTGHLRLAIAVSSGSDTGECRGDAPSATRGWAVSVRRIPTVTVAGGTCPLQPLKGYSAVANFFHFAVSTLNSRAARWIALVNGARMLS